MKGDLRSLSAYICVNLRLALFLCLRINSRPFVVSPFSSCSLCLYGVKFVFIVDFAVPHHGAIRRGSLSWYELAAVSTKARPGLPVAELPPG